MIATTTTRRAPAHVTIALASTVCRGPVPTSARITPGTPPQRCALVLATTRTGPFARVAGTLTVPVGSIIEARRGNHRRWFVALADGTLHLVATRTDRARVQRLAAYLHGRISLAALVAA